MAPLSANGYLSTTLPLGSKGVYAVAANQYMKALVFPTQWQVKLIDTPIPEPGPQKY